MSGFAAVDRLKAGKSAPGAQVTHEGRQLSLLVPDVKADRLGLKAALPAAITFAIPYLRGNKRIIVVDATGMPPACPFPDHNAANAPACAHAWRLTTLMMF